jgi:EmrB/QacA subfamily drug resistance transporter
MDAAAGSGDRLDRNTVMALVAMGVAVLIVANDFTALSVALPSIEEDLDSDLATVQWLINAYALVFGVLIVTGGRLADMFGRRRIFVTGAAIFAGFSLLGGAAQSAEQLIACRALMGVGGAMMWPAILGMTYAALPESKAGLAGGLILGAAGFGNAIGPMFGGLLTDELSWRWIFFVNVPIAAFGVFVTLRAIRPDKPVDASHRIDYAGISTLSLGLVALLVALDQSSDWGWGDERVVGLIVACVVLLVAFVFVERSAGEAALVPRDVIANRDFAAACLTVLLLSAVFFAALLYLPQFMTKVLGYSALKSGAGLLPMMATFASVSFLAGPLYQRLGPKVIVSAGSGCCAVGILRLSFLDSGDGYTALLPGMIVLGIGFGLFYSSVTTAGVTALDPSRASLAGGIVYMFQIAGGSVGLGLNTAIVTSGLDEGLTGFVDGIADAFLVDAVLAFAGFAVALLFVGGRMRRELLDAHRPHLHRAHPG